jgi:hypothetical protein
VIGWGVTVYIDVVQDMNMEGSCKHGNEPSVHREYWEILEKLSDWQLLKMCSAPWS